MALSGSTPRCDRALHEEDFPPIHIRSAVDFLAWVADSVTNRTGRVLAPLYASSYRLAASDPGYRRTLSETLNYSDGTGVVWALRRLRVPCERVALTDIIDRVFRLANSNRWSVFLYGGSPEVLAATVDHIHRLFHEVRVVGAVDGYRDLDATKVGRLKPDLVLVARGAPLQEMWSVAAASKPGVEGNVGVFLTCGGLFDFLAGKRWRAPKLMQRFGLEWLFRSAQEPKRLFPRYLVGNTWFLTRFILRPNRSLLPRDFGSRVASQPGR